MNPITPLWDQMPLQPMQMGGTLSAATPESGAIENPFTDIFKSAVQSVKETDAEKTEMEYLMATGQLDNPALLTIASSKAELAVDLLVQLRNKAMDAYSELMRISL